MPEKLSWRLVIDASVTSSASPRKDLPDPTPRRCRELLDDVLEICHRVVTSRPLREEWSIHRSAYASSWLTRMYGRKKVVAIPEEPEDPDLHRAILATATSEAEAEALGKDLHLVDAALATDGIVVSRDERARDLFRRAAEAVAALRDLQWVDPVRNEGVGRWLRSRSKRGRSFKLGSKRIRS